MTILTLPPTGTPVRLVHPPAWEAGPAARGRLNWLHRYRGLLAAWFADVDVYSDTGLLTPVTTSGSTVAGIPDASGQGRHLTQATASKRMTLVRPGPLNGHSCLRGDAVDDYYVNASMPHLSGNQSSFLAVVTLNNTTAGCGIFEYGTNTLNSGDSCFKNTNGTVVIHRIRSGAANRDAVTQAWGGLPVTSILTGSYQAGNHSIRRDAIPMGAPVTTAGTLDNTLTTLNVGALGTGTTFPLNGDLYALLLFREALSQAELNRAEQDLSGYFGIPLAA